MALTDDDIDKIARLARLRPTSGEKRKLLSDLNKILEYMEIIDEIDIEGVKGMSNAIPQANTVQRGFCQARAFKK